jgi:uncharacterized protein (DUF1919 family)
LSNKSKHQPEPDDPTTCKQCSYLNNIDFIKYTQPHDIYLLLRLHIQDKGNYCPVYRKKIDDIKIKNCL